MHIFQGLEVILPGFWGDSWTWIAWSSRFHWSWVFHWWGNKNSNAGDGNAWFFAFGKKKGPLKSQWILDQWWPWCQAHKGNWGRTIMPSCHPAVLVVRKVLQTGLANSSTLVRTWSSLPGERFMGCKAHPLSPPTKSTTMFHHDYFEGRNFDNGSFFSWKGNVQDDFSFS